MGWCGDRKGVGVGVEVGVGVCLIDAFHFGQELVFITSDDGEKSKCC